MNIQHKTININGRNLKYYPLSQLAGKYDIDSLPYSFKIMLENVLRNYDGVDIDDRSIENIAKLKSGSEMAFKPSRVIFQDSKLWAEKCKFHRNGILEEIQFRKFIWGVIIIQDLEKIISYLAKYKAEYYVGTVTQAPESDADMGVW